MATVVQLQQAPAVVVTQQAPPPKNLGCIKGMAITQLVLGAGMTLLGIVAAAISPLVYIGAAGCGIGGGVWVTVTGIIGVLSAKDWQNRCMRGAYLALSIICAIGSFGWGILYILAVAWYSITTYCSYRVRTNGWGLEAYNCGKKDGVLAVHALLSVLAFVEFVLSITASCFGCCNCGDNSNNTVVVHPQPQVAMTTTQYVQQPQQPPMYAQQPQPVQPLYPQPQPYPPTQPQPYPVK